MAKGNAKILFRILLFSLAFVIICSFSIAWWLSLHYKRIISDKLPEIVTNSSDSVYHISFNDISVNIFTHRVTITDLKLWPDEKQVAWLIKQHRSTPVTLSTVHIPYLEADGIKWEDLISNKSLDCKNVVVHDLKWSMLCKQSPDDPLLTHDKKKDPAIGRITSQTVHFIQPDVTYHYIGTKSTFDFFMKGGTADLNNFAYNYDPTKDTSTFLYAHSGKVRFESIIFSKPSGLYIIKMPDIDFSTTANTVTLKLVKIKQMRDNDPQTGKTKEIYNIDIPSLELAGFNWNKLINHGVLKVPKANANDPSIEIQYIRENNPANGRMGAYPQQLLLQVGLKTNIEELNIHNGLFKYTEVTPKGDQGTVIFSGINGQFSNITNLPKAIARNNNCTVKLSGKYMGKSPLSTNFELCLADTTGRFKLDGYLKDLEGDDVTPQAQAFTIVEVTSFHLKEMDMHIEGDQTYSKGDFTVLYNDLKISLFKFDTKHREGKKGTLAFLGSTLLLYSDNPLPGKDVRKVSTSFARDTTKGFVNVIWQHMFRAAKKTAVREKALVTITDGPETSKGQKPKKGIFTRLFGKKK